MIYRRVVGDGEEVKLWRGNDGPNLAFTALKQLFYRAETSFLIYPSCLYNVS
jgi:hypothetical protein